MSESYDVELSRALKESAAKELGGWEFTPAMRAKVLEQIRAEEAGQPAPAAPAPRRFAPAPILRPLAWVAVAAAAFAVVLNVGIPGTSKKESQTAAPSAAAPAEMKMTTAEASQQVADNAGQSATGPEAPRAKSAPGAESAGDAGVASVEPAGQGEAFTITGAAASSTVLELTPPMDVAALKAPAQPTTLGIAAASPRNVALASGVRLVSLNQGSVQLLDEASVPVWEQPLENLTDAGRVAQSPDGRIAVANGTNQLTLFSATGERQRTLTTSAAAGSLQWSLDGRLAVTEGSRVYVYNAATGKQEFSVDAGTPADVAFLPDGSFATFGGPVGDSARLVVADRKGALLVDRVSETGGRGLAVTAGGRVIVAGGQAYDPAGNPLWPVPTIPLGVAALGSDMVAVWDTQKVFVLNGHDGSTVLEAAWNGGGQGVRKVVPSADGRYLAIVALTEQGPVVWVVDATGAQLLAEKLGEMPVDLAIAGNRLVIMLEHSVTVRELPQ